LSNTNNKPGRSGSGPRSQADYAFTIPGRDEVLALLEAEGRPLAAREIFSALKLKGEPKRQAMRKRLGAMGRDGQLIINRKGEYCLTARIHLVTGVVQGHRDGFGFLIPEDGSDDVFLPPRTMRSLMHGDRAAVRVQKNADGRFEGRLVDVLERGRKRIAGTYFREHGIGFVSPADPRFPDDVVIPPEDAGEAKPGLLVTAELTAFPGRRTPAMGRIVEVLGRREQAGMATELAIRNQIDRFDLVIDALDRVPALRVAGAHVKDSLRDRQIDVTEEVLSGGLEKAMASYQRFLQETPDSPMAAEANPFPSEDKTPPVTNINFVLELIDILRHC